MSGPMQRFLRRRDSPSEEQATRELATGPEAQQAETPSADPSFRDRGRLRRRLRYLRRARELGYRDLGGLVFDLHRFGRDRSDLVEAKLATLTAVDEELRALEGLLDDRRPIDLLREPGISACPRCTGLHASQDRFCPSCGLALQSEAPAPAAEPASSP